MSRWLAVLLGVGWRARLPKKPASNSADTAHGKRRGRLLSKGMLLNHYLHPLEIVLGVSLMKR